MATDGYDLWTTPAAQPPDGQTSDFDSPLSEASLFYGVTSVAMVFAIVCVALKLYIRFFIHKQPGLDDLCLVVALGLHLGFTILNDVVFAKGGARHQYDMSMGKFMWVMKMERDSGIIQMLAYLFTKLALLLLYYRLFKAKAAFKWLILFGCGMVAVAYLAFALIYIFVTDYFVILRSNYAMGWFDLVTDVYLWLLPLAVVGSLNLQWYRKLGVAGLFSIGGLACTMSGLSLSYRLNVGNLTDWTWEYPRCNTVIAVEIYVAIVIACVPVFPSLLRDTSWSSPVSKALSRIRGRSGGTSRTDTSSGFASSKGKETLTSTAASRVSGMFGGGRGQTQDEYDWTPVELEACYIQTGAAHGEHEWPLVEYQRPPAQRSDPEGVSMSGLSMDSLYEPSRCSASDSDEAREDVQVSPV